MTPWRRGGGGFGGRLGRASQRERYNADLFMADLLGHRVIEGSSEAYVGEDDPPSAPAAGPPPAPTTTSCARDVAVNESLALLITNNAPLPVTPAEVRRVAADSGARDDYKSVAAIVPATPERRLLIFFHGNNNYVTVAPRRRAGVRRSGWALACAALG